MYPWGGQHPRGAGGGAPGGGGGGESGGGGGGGVSNGPHTLGVMFGYLGKQQHPLTAPKFVVGI